MLDLSFLPLDESAAATSSAASSDWTSNLYMFGMLAFIILIFYFMVIRPQRKKDKEAQNLRNSIQVGDEVTTVGGIIGRVVSIKDESIVIETGADRSKIRIKKWAIQGREAGDGNTSS